MTPPATLADRLAALSSMPLDRLRVEFERATGEPTRSDQTDYLRSRIAEVLRERGDAAHADADPAPAAPTPPTTETTTDTTTETPTRSPTIMTTKKTARPATKTARKGADATPAPAVAGTAPSPFAADPRLPAPGSTIAKRWHDRDLAVQVTGTGFEFEGRPYRSLSAIARELMKGKQVNGFLFFGLVARPGAKGAAAAKKPAKGTPAQVASVAKARVARAAKVAARRAAKKA